MKPHIRIRGIITHTWARGKRPSVREVFERLYPKNEETAVKYIIDDHGQLHITSMTHETLQKRVVSIKHAGDFTIGRSGKIRHVDASLIGGTRDPVLSMHIERVLGYVLRRQGYPVQFETDEDRARAITSLKYSAKPGAWADVHLKKPSPGG